MESSTAEFLIAVDAFARTPTGTCACCIRISIRRLGDCFFVKLQNGSSAQEKASSTLRASRAVPHPGTDRALRRLTSEFGRDPVHSTRYGRWHHLHGHDRNKQRRPAPSNEPIPTK